MKRIVGALLTLLLAFSAPIVSLAEEEIYWGEAPPTGTEITDDDFSINFEKKTIPPTFGDQEVYDTYKASDLESETQDDTGENTPANPAAPIQPEPALRTGPPIRTNISAPPSTQSQSPNTDRATPTRVAPTTPQPAETTPGPPKPSSNPEATVNNSQSPSTTEDADRPSTKKMKWGQTESSADESSAKFQWGRKNQ